MKKKIMAVTLCLAMVSTFAVGCGQKNETDSGKSEEKSSGKVEIEFVQVKREAAESYTKVIEAFEKENPDIVIKQNVVPDAQEVLMTRASSDSLPDMMNHWPTDAQFVQFEDEGLLLDLSEKDYMKNIDSKYLDAVKAKDGKNYIAPYNVNFMGVYYNKDKFEEAGYTMPTKWDELIALAEEIKAKGETPFILPNKDSWTVSNLWSNIEARDLGSHEDEFEKMKAGEESFETIPLVLHGCSDIPEEQMKEAVNLGMSKFNIATEYFRTMYQSIEKRINNQEFEGNGVKLMYDIKEEMIDFVIQKIRLLNPNKYSM